MAFDPVSLLLEVGNKVIDRVWPDPAQAAQAKLELIKMQQSGDWRSLPVKWRLSTRRRRPTLLSLSLAGDRS
jgi:hypothetical protein